MDNELRDYFIRHTDQRFSELHKDLNDIKNRLEDLSAFKWKLTGMALSIVVIIQAVSQFFTFNIK